jgi:hypothetical protein
MSITYRFIALPRERFDGLWACRDETLLEKVLAAKPDRREAIAEILTGGSHPKAYALGAAVETICHVVGQYLGDFYANDVFRVADLLDEAKIDRSLLIDEMSEKWPFPIPDTGIDGPFIGLFPAAQVKGTLADLKRLPVPEDAQLREALEWALRLYEKAAATCTDLVVFQI